MTAARPRVWVVVLNWNNLDDSRDCLASLGACSYPDLKVALVDNGSRDGSGEKLHAEFPQHRYVQTGGNLGFSRGCNAGLRAALEDPECRYALLLNNDATVDPGFLEPLVAAAEAEPRAGAVCGKVLMGGDRLWYAGGSIDVWRGRPLARGIGEVDRGQYDTPEPVGFATGGLMLVPRRVLETVGLLPEAYFFGFEEYDYSVTLQKAGHVLLYEPRSRVFHRVSGSHHNWGPKYLYNNYRNKLTFARKFLPRLAFPAWKLAFVLYTRVLSDRWRRKWVAANDHTGETVPHPERFAFALRHALADDARRVPLDEAALLAYDKLWDARRRELGLPE